MKYSFLNGKIVLREKTGINLNDIALLRGYGIFEFLRTYNSKIFLLDEHFERLENSAFLMNMKIPFSKQETEEIIYELIKKNKQKDVNIRIVITGGKTFNGMSYFSDKATFYILLEEINDLPEICYQKGVKLHLVEHQRLFPEIKTTNYIFPIINKRNLEKSESFDFLYFSKNKVLESSTSNFFIIKKGKLITPRNNILVGTTRNFVINFAKGIFESEERDVEMSEIKEAEEAFLTATNKEIVPVTQVGEIKIGNGKTGEKTKELNRLFKENIKNL